jgi:hypothetical protein
MVTKPPALDPFEWEESPVFRETFLLHVTVPEYNAALRTVARFLYEMALEYRHWPAPPESHTTSEMRAALADLRHLQGYFSSVGRERRNSRLSPLDADLARLAARLGLSVAVLADEIEETLAVIEKSDQPSGQ